MGRYDHLIPAGGNKQKVLDPTIVQEGEFAAGGNNGRRLFG